MNKLIIVAASLALMLGTTATTTFAASNVEGGILVDTIPDRGPDPEKDPSPKDPTPKDDPKPQDNPKPVSITSVPDRTPTPEVHTSCGDEMGFLRMIRKQQVQAVMNEKVVIMPVCEGSSNVGSLFMEGNVGGLRNMIGLNETLSAELTEEDFDSQDVVGIRFGKDTVVLYVHKR